MQFLPEAHLRHPIFERSSAFGQVNYLFSRIPQLYQFFVKFFQKQHIWTSLSQYSIERSSPNYSSCWNCSFCIWTMSLLRKMCEDIRTVFFNVLKPHVKAPIRFSAKKMLVSAGLLGKTAFFLFALFAKVNRHKFSVYLSWLTHHRCLGITLLVP